MDATLAIEHDRQGLLHILATLIAMAGARTTLPRHLRNTILRLLRPAEAATRRLVIALARGLVVTLTRTSASKQTLRRNVVTPLFVKSGTGTGIVLPRGVTAIPNSPHSEPAEPEPVEPYGEPVEPLPLIDRLPRPFAVRRTYIPPHRDARNHRVARLDATAVEP